MVEPDYQERARAIKCLGELRTLLAVETGVKIPIHDESFLIRFVRAKKYDPQLALKTIKNYYDLRARNPKLFSIAYPSHPVVKDILDKCIIGKLKSPDIDGQPVIMFSFGMWTPEVHEMNHIIAAYTLILDEVLRDENGQRSGITFLFDQSLLGMEHIKQLASVKVLRNWVNIFQGSYPLRFKNITIANESSLFEIVMTIVRPFLSEKLKSRLKFFGSNYDYIHAIVPKDGLPEVFGGPLKYEDAFDKEMIFRALKRDNYYKELLEYGYKETDSDEEDTYM